MIRPNCCSVAHQIKQALQLIQLVKSLLMLWQPHCCAFLDIFEAGSCGGIVRYKPTIITCRSKKRHQLFLAGWYLDLSNSFHFHLLWLQLPITHHIAKQLHRELALSYLGCEALLLQFGQCNPQVICPGLAVNGHIVHIIPGTTGPSLVGRPLVPPLNQMASS